MKPLHISLNTAHSGCKPNVFISSFTHSYQVFLPLPTHLTPATTTFLQADTQSSPLLRSTRPNDIKCHHSQYGSKRELCSRGQWAMIWFMIDSFACLNPLNEYCVLGSDDQIEAHVCHIVHAPIHRPGSTSASTRPRQGNLWFLFGYLDYRIYGSDFSYPSKSGIR